MKTLTDGERDILDEANADATLTGESEEWADYLSDCDYNGQTPSDAGFAQWKELP